MLNPKLFDDIASQLNKVLPPELRAVHSDLEKNFRTILQGAFAKLNLVTREEFDVQTAVLAKTRAKLTELEKQVASLEKSVSSE